MKKYREIVTRLLVDDFSTIRFGKNIVAECRSTDNRPTRLIQEGGGEKRKKREDETGGK